jgi:hypothetical protein
VDWHAPFAIVITEHQRIAAHPRTSLQMHKLPILGHQSLEDLACICSGGSAIRTWVGRALPVRSSFRPAQLRRTPPGAMDQAASWRKTHLNPNPKLLEPLRDVEVRKDATALVK